MLRQPKGARRYNDRVTLTKSTAYADDFGHADICAPVAVLEVWAEVRQMSATKTMLTFQQADVVGVDLEFRLPQDGTEFDGAVWRGREIHFPHPEIVDNRGRIVRVSGWYQVDAPVQEPMPVPEAETEEDAEAVAE